VNYADDFVILCRRNAAEAGEPMEAIMAKKIRVCRVPEESFEFLGWGCHSSQTGRSYTGTRVAKKRVKRLCEENQPADASDYRVRKPESWWELSTRNCEANYFSLGPVSKTYRAVDSHMRYRLRRWLCNKHKVQGPGGKTFPERLGLLRLEARTANLPWAKA
jgi:hypothetical protein